MKLNIIRFRTNNLSPINDNVIFSYSTCAIAFPTSLRFSSFKTETLTMLQQNKRGVLNGCFVAILTYWIAAEFLCKCKIRGFVCYDYWHQYLRLIIYDFPEQGVQMASICDHNSKSNIKNWLLFVIGSFGQYYAIVWYEKLMKFFLVYIITENYSNLERIVHFCG